MTVTNWFAALHQLSRGDRVLASVTKNRDGFIYEVRERSNPQPGFRFSRLANILGGKHAPSR